jgi:predicted ArsR family transcriptional regulator
MNLLPLLREIVHAPVLEIILLLKRSTGMSVNELCREMKMSYMGVKQHCMGLEKKRLLDTWRRPKPAGRPEKVYRLTSKIEGLFPELGNEWSLSLLETADQVFGERAAAKLLFNLFQKRTQRWQKVVQGTTVAIRVRELGKLRAAEGYLTLVHDVEGGLDLVDHHDPCGSVALRYPLVQELDLAAVEQLLGVSVARSVEEAAGLKRVTHRVLFPQE